MNYSPDTSELEMLSAYLDNALGEPERAALEQRLNTDPALRTRLESLRDTVRLLKSAPALAPPRDFRLDPGTFRRPALRPRRTIWWSLGALSAAAAVLLVALIAVSNLTNLGSSAPQAAVLIVTRPPNVALRPTNLPTAKAAVSESGNSTGSDVAAPVASAAPLPATAAADQAVRSALPQTNVPATPSPVPSITPAAQVTQAALASTNNVLPGASGGAVGPQNGASNSAANTPTPGSTLVPAPYVFATATPEAYFALQPTASSAALSAANKLVTLWDFIRWLLTLFGLKGLP
jgi:hypothetical protein